MDDFTIISLQAEMEKLGLQCVQLATTFLFHCGLHTKKTLRFIPIQCVCKACGNPFRFKFMRPSKYNCIIPSPINLYQPFFVLHTHTFCHRELCECRMCYPAYILDMDEHVFDPYCTLQQHILALC